MILPASGAEADMRRFAIFERVYEELAKSFSIYNLQDFLLYNAINPMWGSSMERIIFEKDISWIEQFISFENVVSKEIARLIFLTRGIPVIDDPTNEKALLMKE